MAENRTRYAILGALTLEPMSGYDLKRFADESVAHFWAESYGQIYPILKQLVAEKLIAPTTRKRTGPRDRVAYAITDRGREVLRRWLSEPAEHQTMRIEILLKLFFARNAAPGDAIRVVESFRGDYLAKLGRYEGTEAHLRAERAEHADLPYWLMTLSYGRHVTRALVAWADETIAALRRLEGEPRSGQKRPS